MLPLELLARRLPVGSMNACPNGAEVRLDIVVAIIAIVKRVAVAVMTYLFFSY